VNVDYEVGIISYYSYRILIKQRGIFNPENKSFCFLPAYTYKSKKRLNQMQLVVSFFVQYSVQATKVYFIMTFLARPTISCSFWDKISTELSAYPELLHDAISDRFMS